MRKLTKHFAAIGCCIFTSLSAATPITFEFSQSGFSSGGTIEGFFTGTDLDGDGRIYAASEWATLIAGVPSGNELDYAEVTFSGFGTQLGPQTVIFDKSVADMTLGFVGNLFMAIAYNIDGGILGDDPDEGISLSLFSPSTNFWLGNAFSGYFSAYTGVDERGEPNTVGVCGGSNTSQSGITKLNNCGAVLEFAPIPGSDDPLLVSADYSTQNLSFTQVSSPHTLSLFGLGLFTFLLFRENRRAC